MFRIAFASYRDSCIEKRVFKNSFPTIYKFITEYKKLMTQLFMEGGDDNFNHKGNAAFPVLLQNIESSLFVDTILTELLNKNIKALSKHDSILCKESDVQKVKLVIQRVLDGLLGENTYKLTIETQTSAA